MVVNKMDSASQVVILGAGPAGLTAAYALSNLALECVVLEQDAVVGGLARTVEYKGFRFDIGGHRFYTKISLVQQIWRNILGDGLLSRKRFRSSTTNRGSFNIHCSRWTPFAGSARSRHFVAR